MPKSSTETGNPWSVIARLRHWMHDGLRPLAPDAAVLAVGCEQAFLAPQLAEYSADVTVLDTSGAQIGQFSRRSLAKLVRAAGFTDVHAMSAGAPRRAASGPRQLLLRARKSLVDQDVKAPARRRAIAPVTELARDQAGAARAA